MLAGRREPACVHPASTYLIWTAFDGTLTVCQTTQRAPWRQMVPHETTCKSSNLYEVGLQVKPVFNWRDLAIPNKQLFGRFNADSERFQAVKLD